ncbi:unnamed protein product [Rhizophagus irregularis]|nr:unnamed protein product [Rhizophagus irregularis]
MAKAKDMEVLQVRISFKSNLRRSVTTVKGSHGYLRKNGIYNQQRKINARTFSIDRVSWLQDQHKDDGLCSTLVE